MRNLESESDHGPLRPLFDRRLKLEGTSKNSPFSGVVDLESG